MPRPKELPCQIKINLNDKTKDALLDLASAQGQPVATIVRTAINMYVRHQDLMEQQQENLGRLESLIAELKAERANPGCNGVVYNFDGPLED